MPLFASSAQPARGLIGAAAASGSVSPPVLKGGAGFGRSSMLPAAAVAAAAAGSSISGGSIGRPAPSPSPSPSPSSSPPPSEGHLIEETPVSDGVSLLASTRTGPPARHSRSHATTRAPNPHSRLTGVMGTELATMIASTGTGTSAALPPVRSLHGGRKQPSHRLELSSEEEEEEGSNALHSPPPMQARTPLGRATQQVQQQSALTPASSSLDGGARPSPPLPRVLPALSSPSSGRPSLPPLSLPTSNSSSLKATPVGLGTEAVQERAAPKESNSKGPHRRLVSRPLSPEVLSPSSLPSPVARTNAASQEHTGATVASSWDDDDDDEETEQEGAVNQGSAVQQQQQARASISVSAPLPPSHARQATTPLRPRGQHKSRSSDGSMPATPTASESPRSSEEGEVRAHRAGPEGDRQRAPASAMPAPSPKVAPAPKAAAAVASPWDESDDEAEPGNNGSNVTNSSTLKSPPAHTPSAPIVPARPLRVPSSLPPRPSVVSSAAPAAAPSPSARDDWDADDDDADAAPVPSRMASRSTTSAAALPSPVGALPLSLDRTSLGKAPLDSSGSIALPKTLPSLAPLKPLGGGGALLPSKPLLPASLPAAVSSRGSASLLGRPSLLPAPTAAAATLQKPRMSSLPMRGATSDDDDMELDIEEEEAPRSRLGGATAPQQRAPGAVNEEVEVDYSDWD